MAACLWSGARSIAPPRASRSVWLGNYSTQRRGGRRGRRGGPCGARAHRGEAGRNDVGREHKRTDGHELRFPRWRDGPSGHGARTILSLGRPLGGLLLASRATVTPKNSGALGCGALAPSGAVSWCPSLRWCPRPELLWRAQAQQSRAPHGPPLRPLRPPRLRVEQFQSIPAELFRRPGDPCPLATVT